MTEAVFMFILNTCVNFVHVVHYLPFFGKNRCNLCNNHLKLLQQNFE